MLQLKKEKKRRIGKETKRSRHSINQKGMREVVRFGSEVMQEEVWFRRRKQVQFKKKQVRKDRRFREEVQLKRDRSVQKRG